MRSTQDWKHIANLCSVAEINKIFTNPARRDPHNVYSPALSKLVAKLNQFILQCIEGYGFIRVPKRSGGGMLAINAKPCELRQFLYRCRRTEAVIDENLCRMTFYFGYSMRPRHRQDFISASTFIPKCNLGTRRMQDKGDGLRPPLQLHGTAAGTAAATSRPAQGPAPATFEMRRQFTRRRRPRCVSGRW